MGTIPLQPESATVSDASPRGHRRRPILIGGGLLAALAIVYAADVALAQGDVPRGVSIAGVDVGGVDRDVAERRLTQAFEARLDEPVEVAADDVTGTIDAEEVGLRLDVDATLDEAGDASLNPWTRLRSFFTEVEVDPVSRVDDEALRSDLAELAAKVDRPAREGEVRFEGTTPVPVLPLTGRTLDLDESTLAVADGWWRDVPVPLVVETDEVKTTEDDVETAVDEIARPAVAAPIVLDVEGKTVTIPPSAIAAALTITANDEGELEPELDPKKLHDAALAEFKTVEVMPKDARIDIVDGKPKVVAASVTGLTADPETLVSTVEPLLTRPSPRRAPYVLVEKQPKVTTERANALGIREVIGTFTTRHPCCRPRVTNIHRMADIVDGHLVLPGETFSLNGKVGERTRAKGFVDAPQILEGEFVDDVGGGVSQFATTMFNAVFFSGLKDVEHKAHSYYITRYPEGREATVFYPQVDLKWQNDSPTGVLVKTSYTGSSITVTFWGTKRYDIEAVKSPRSRIRPFEKKYIQRDDCTPASGHEGFDVTVTRIFKQNGREVKREKFFTRYLPEPNFICGPPPSDTPASTASASPAPAPTPAPSPSKKK